MLVSCVAFAVGCAAALYFTFGYPLLLSLLARKRPARLHKAAELKSVSVILAVHNGQRWIRAKLQSILALQYPRHLLQIIVVSDGSTDKTDAYVREYAGEGVELVRIGRAGKAAALNAALEYASGDILFFTDVRQPLHPDSLGHLVCTIGGDPAIGAACGHVLFVTEEAREAVHMGLYWRYEKWVRRNLSRLDSLLAGTGCLYAMRRELAAPLPHGLVLDDSWLPLCAFMRGYRFVLDEEAVAYEYPTSLRVEFRRKVRTLAGIYQITMACPDLLRKANRMRFHFISYQLGRVLLPFALLLMAAGGVGLPGGWGRLALWAEATVCVLALADPFVPAGAPVTKRLTSFVSTVFVMMIASLCAVSIFFRPAESFWKETTLQQR